MRESLTIPAAAGYKTATPGDSVPLDLDGVPLSDYSALETPADPASPEADQVRKERWSGGRIAGGLRGRAWVSATVESDA